MCKAQHPGKVARICAVTQNITRHLLIGGGSVANRIQGLVFLRSIDGGVGAIGIKLGNLRTF